MTTNAELELKITSEIEETFDTETSTFDASNLEMIVTSLYDNEVIEWRLIPDEADLMAYKSVTDQTGYVFFICSDPDELSTEDFIDLIIKIENEYESTKDTVKFNG
uniref:Uncharacterized protein n=1 Tax=viral metagenome TaxID=1070528 RepID=A0A6M3LYP3_9ZZZZ